MRSGTICAVALLLGLSEAVEAQVDCSNPDNLCTGDPCVIGTITVASPCVVDFTPRAVRIAGTLTVPAHGLFSLSAASVEVTGSLVGAATASIPVQDITLLATNDLVIAGPIRLMNDRPETQARFEAGGDLSLHALGRITCVGQQAACDITLDAGGDLRVERPIRSGTFFDSITLLAGGNIDVLGTLRAGEVGLVTADAGGVLTVAAPIRQRSRQFMTLRGDLGVDIRSNIKLTDEFTGSLEVSSSAGPVSVSGSINVTPHTSSSDDFITIQAAGDVTISGPLSIPADILISSSAGNVLISKRLRPGLGDDVIVQAAGLADLRGDIRVPSFLSAHGGIRVVAGEVAVRLGARLSIDNEGALRIAATSGDATLSGTFEASNGIIEASAATDLTADGVFRATSGCIAVSAGGTLDTSGASFDVTPVPDCPGSPSGAFLD